MSKPFILFAAPAYYPRGGMEDMKGVFRTMDEALKAMSELDRRDRSHCSIVDMSEGYVYAYDMDGISIGISPVEFYHDLFSDDL